MSGRAFLEVALLSGLLSLITKVFAIKVEDLKFDRVFLIVALRNCDFNDFSKSALENFFFGREKTRSNFLFGYGLNA